jgi:hypothetical protein
MLKFADQRTVFQQSKFTELRDLGIPDTVSIARKVTV